MKRGPNNKLPHPPKVYKRMAATQKKTNHPWRKPFYFSTADSTYVPKRVV